MKDDVKKTGVIVGEKKNILQKKPDKRKIRDPIFVGIDPSFNGMGIVIIDKKANILKQILYKAKPGEVEERLLDIEKATRFIPTIMNLYKVYMEGPSYQSAGQAVLQMGALHFLLRLNFLKRGVNYEIITPGTLKKFVADKGNAKKELMLLKTYKKWGVEFDDNNLCDAYGLARMVLEEYKIEFKEKDGQV